MRRCAMSSTNKRKRKSDEEAPNKKAAKQSKGRDGALARNPAAEAASGAPPESARGSNGSDAGAWFVEGTKVLGKWQGHEHDWHPAIIVRVLRSIEGVASYDIDYTDGSGDKERGVAAHFVALDGQRGAEAEFGVDDDVKARYQGRGRKFYGSTIVGMKLLADGTTLYDVKYEDGSIDRDLCAKHIRLVKGASLKSPPEEEKAQEEEEERAEQKVGEASKDVSAKGVGAEGNLVSPNDGEGGGGGGDAGPEGGGEGGEDPSQGRQGVVELSTAGEDGGEVTSAGNEEGPLLVAVKAVGGALGGAAKGAAQWLAATAGGVFSNSNVSVANLEMRPTDEGLGHVYHNTVTGKSVFSPPRGAKRAHFEVQCDESEVPFRPVPANVQRITLDNIRNELKKHKKLDSGDFAFLLGGGVLAEEDERNIDVKDPSFGFGGNGTLGNPYRLSIKITSHTTFVSASEATGAEEYFTSTAGVIYLPFTSHCLSMVVAHIDELSQFFTVSFLSKDELDEHTLLNATHKISAEAMKGWLAKEIFQEEIYCRLTAKDIKQGAYDPSLRRAMMEVFGRIPDVDNVRIMKLMATRENHQKFPKSTPHLEGRRIRGLNVGGWVGIGGEMQRSSGIDEPDALVVWESILAQATGRRGSKRKREHEVGDVGYSFRKWFDAGWFEGKVTEILPEALDGRDRRCVYSDGDAENLSVEELRALARADRPAKKPKAAKRKRRTKKVVSDESASDDADQIEAGAAEDIEMAGASADAADAVDAAESESEREGGEESSEPEMLSLAARAADEEATPSRTRAAEGREADDTPEAIPAEARKETRNEAVAEAPARSPKAPRRRKKAKSTMEDDASALEEQIAAEVSASERKTRSSKARADKKDMSGAADAPKGRGASTKTPEAAEESRRRTNSSRAKQAAATEDDGAQAKDEGRKAHRGSSKGRDKSANALELEEDASSGGGKAGESRDTRSRGARKEADEEEQPVVNAHDGDFGGDGGFEVEAEMGGAGGAPGPGAIEGAGSIPAPSTILVGASTAGGGGTLDAAPGEAGSPRQHVEAVELADEGSVGEEHEEVGERPEDEEDDDVTEERLEGASDGAPAPPPLAKAAPTPPRPAHRRKKKDAGGVQLFAFRSPESGTETAAGPSTPGAASDRRPKRKLKSIARYSDSNPHAKPPKGEGYKHGEGFLCPRCGHVCSYDARVCEDCHLECYYEAGVGVVTLRERRANEPEAKKQTRAGRKEVGKGEGRGREAGEKRGVKRGSLKGRPSKTDGKTGENKAPTEDADVKDDETDTESSSSEDASGEHRAVGAGEEKTKSAGEKKPARKKSRARGGETTAKQSAPRAVPRRGAAIKAASKLSRDMSEEDSGSDDILGR
ncbi:hypothetical protein ACHAXT_009544 [Thalassiosira profunda]